MTSPREEWPNHRRLVGAIFSFGMGLLSLYAGFNRPSIANMRGIDLVHLVASGMALGVGLMAFVVYLIHRGKG